MEFAAAALAGILARLVSHPLDTVKTVSFTGFAADGGPTARMGYAQAVRTIWAGEGWRGFYRGVGVTVLGAAPGVGMYLSCYHYAHQHQQEFAQRFWRGDTPRAVSHWISFTSGLVAEAVSCLVWVPIDVSKERLQSQPPSLAGRYSGSFNALQTIIRLEGLRGLYKGYWSTLGSFGPFSGLYFVFYEYFTSRLRATGLAKRDGGSARLWVPLAAGCGATAVACVCTNPLELVKTRLQVQRTVLKSPRGSAAPTRPLFAYQYRGLCSGLRGVAAREGVTGLWRGTAARILFQAPNAALTMVLYDFFLSRCRSRREKEGNN